MSNSAMDARQRATRQQLRALRTERDGWLQGRYLPWGVPWCPGPGSPYHSGPVCEGCAARVMCEERAAEIGGTIGRRETENAELAAPRGKRAAQARLW